MKSGNPIYRDKDSGGAAFWLWFASISDQLAQNVENPVLLAELDCQIRLLCSQLSWEVGPGRETECQLTISPSLNPDLLDLTRRIVSQSPRLTNWEFHSARQPKAWNGTLEMMREDGTKIKLDASGWKYVLLRYPDGAHEIVLHADNIHDLNESERWHAAAIVLEGLLGEETLIQKVHQFELTDSVESRLLSKLKPICQVKKAIAIRES